MVHLHHTWRPTKAQYRKNPRRVMEGMWRYHTQINGWADFGQHLTIGAEGELWLGRDWNRPPASQPGHNGTRLAGPFMIEMIGDFDQGQEQLEPAQRTSVLTVITAVQQHFQLPPEALLFHNQMSGKTCPGSGIPYEAFLGEVRLFREAA
jgi:hypothetical protein